MNRYITYTAKSKIFDLLKNEKYESLMINVCPRKRMVFEFSDQKNIPQGYIIASLFPKVFMHNTSVNMLKEAMIDFDYSTDEFILSKEN